MIDVAHRAVDDGAKLALPLADRGRHTAHVGNLIDPLQHQHVARLGQIMRLDLGQAGDAAGDRLGDACLGRNIPDRQRAPDQAGRRIGRLEHARRHGAGNAEFVHGVRRHAGEIGQSVKAFDNVGGERRQIQHAEGIGGEFSEGLFGHGRNATRLPTMAASRRRRPFLL